MENEPFSMRSRNEGGHVPKGLGEVVGGACGPDRTRIFHSGVSWGWG
jgi:hypothetical protein